MRGVLPPSCRNHGNKKCTVQKMPKRTTVLKTHVNINVQCNIERSICRIDAECINMILNSQWVHTRMHGSIYRHIKGHYWCKIGNFPPKFSILFLCNIGFNKDHSYCI